MYTINLEFTGFNPRSPHGERLGDAVRVLRGFDVSIHAPRMGSDREQDVKSVMYNSFNPRSPHGERRYLFAWQKSIRPFQSTLPAWGATLSNQAQY